MTTPDTTPTPTAASLARALGGEDVLHLARWIRGYTETPYPAPDDWTLRLHPSTRLKVLASPEAMERWDLAPGGFMTLAGVRIVSDPDIPEGAAELRLAARMPIPALAAPAEAVAP